MNPINYSLLLTSSVLVLIFMDITEAAPGKCVFKCVKGVIKCKRDQKTPGLLPPGTNCCDLYSECYLGCDPTADSVPPCENPKIKRGSWNKRAFPRYFQSGDFDLPLNYNVMRRAYDRNDPLSFLFENQDDLE